MAHAGQKLETVAKIYGYNGKNDCLTGKNKRQRCVGLFHWKNQLLLRRG